MPEVVDKLTYALDYDLAGTKAKAREAEADAQRLGGAVKAATKDAFDPATAGAAKLGAQLKITAKQYQVMAAEAAASGKSVESLIAAHFKAGEAAKASSKKTVEARAAEILAAKQAMAAAKEAQIAAARASPNATPLRSFQVANLVQQAQDALVQFGSGQNPLTILLQQGPQITTAAGGVSNAFKLLGGAAGIAKLAVGGLVVGGLAAFVAASVQASEASAKIETGLRLTGNAAGLTRDRIRELALDLDRTTRLSTSGAEKMIGVMTARGNVPGALVGRAAGAAGSLDTATSMDGKEAAQYIEQILAKPAEGAKTLVEDFKLLSSAERRQVENLAASGRAYEAQEILVRLMNERFGGAANEASGLSKALAVTGKAASNFMNWLGGLVAGQTTRQKLAELEDEIASPQYANVGLAQRARDKAEVARYKAELAKPATEAAAARRNAAIEGSAAGVASYDVEAQRARQRTETTASIQAGLDAARESQRLNPTAEGLALVKERERALRNAQNPNYRPGSGVPAGRSGARIDTGARDAELARMEVANARALAAAPARDREALRARQQAEAEFTRNSADPRRRGAAAGIRDSRMEAFGIAQAGRQADVVTAITEETAAQLKMADAYAKGTAAAAMQVTQGQAHAAWLQGQIANEDEYARALASRAAAQARATTEQSLAQQRLGNAALGRLVAAGGDPAAMGAARVENEALAATQAARDTAQAQRDLAKSTEEIAAADLALAAAETALATARKQGGEGAGFQRQIAANDFDRQARESLDLKQAEIRLTYASTETRIKEISAIQAYQQAVREGLTVGSADFQARYDELRKINEQLALADATLSGQTRNVQVLDAVRQGLGDIAMAGTRGFRSMEDAASSFFRQLGDLIVQLYVIQPLLNGLLGTSKSGGGGLLGNFISGLFGGGVGGGGGEKIGSGFMATGEAWHPAAKVGGIAGVLKALSRTTAPGPLTFGGPRAMGGPVSTGRAYLVGENGPELFAPGASGNIVPIRAPSATAAQSGGGGRQDVVFSYNVTVSGNGDAELMSRMQMIAGQTVQSGLEQYSAADNRSLRQRVQQSGRRALR